MIFAHCDSDTQCDGRNSDSISPFLLVFLFHQLLMESTQTGTAEESEKQGGVNETERDADEQQDHVQERRRNSSGGGNSSRAGLRPHGTDSGAHLSGLLWLLLSLMLCLPSLGPPVPFMLQAKSLCMSHALPMLGCRFVSGSNVESYLEAGARSMGVPGQHPSNSPGLEGTSSS